MPIYEFSCSKCGNFEVKQSIHEDHIAVCPNCKAMAIRVFTPTAVIFNAPGFPGNDMKKKSIKDPKVSTDEKKTRLKKAKKTLRDFGVKQKPTYY